MGLSAETELSRTQGQRLQQLASEFQKAWKAAKTIADAPVLDTLLPPPEDSLREDALHELIKTDLSMRWQRGERICVEEYVDKFPELGNTPKLLARLLFAEYSIRHEHGDKPHESVYKVRFPERFAEVLRLIEDQKYKTVVAPASPVPSPAVASISGAPIGQDGVLHVGSGYRLVKRIGSGSFGEVWRAIAPGGIPVAIKIIFRPIDHEFAQRELQSLELIKSLSHPYLVQTQAYWPLEDRLVIVMELADGSLSSRMKECQDAGESGIPAAELLGYFHESAEALDYLHGEHVQHRDIKPDNILLLRRHAKVADFGLARLQESLRPVNATACGTPAYMAPEVWKGKISQNSDQYSLAMTYIELRLGRPPFPVMDMVTMMEDHLRNQPDLAPLDEAEQKVILKAVSKDAEQRYPSCREFAEALARSVLGETATGERATLASPLRTWTSRCLWMLMACGLGLLIAFAIYRWNLASLTIESPPPVVVVTGRTAALTMHLQRHNFKEPVNLSFKGLPSGIKIADTTVPGDEEAVELEVVAKPDARPGVTQVGVQADSGERQIEAWFELTVLFLPPGAENVGDDIVPDSNGRKFYKRIACRLPNDAESIEFVVVPKTRNKDPETCYMMKNKVSVGLYRRFVEAHPISQKSWNEDGWSDECPAFGVGVEDAYHFAELLYGRLPTRQQWDKAAGLNEPSDREGPYNGKWSEDAKLDIAVARKMPRKVGAVKDDEGPMKIGAAKDDEGPFGCRDMAGNGKEWTRDCVVDRIVCLVPLRPDQQRDATVYLRSQSYTDPTPLKYKQLENEDVGIMRYRETGRDIQDIGFRVVIELP